MINLEQTLKSKRILIVDDLVEARSALKKMTTLLGCEHIDTATDGKEASELLTAYDYDIVFSDYNLGRVETGSKCSKKRATPTVCEQRPCLYWLPERMPLIW